MGSVNHRFALSNPAFVSARSKKSFSSFNWPILACAVRGPQARQHRQGNLRLERWRVRAAGRRADFFAIKNSSRQLYLAGIMLGVFTQDAAQICGAT